MARARSNGAITFVQRFNSALELSLHFHMLVPDGVFVAGDGGVDERPRFVALTAPSDACVVEPTNLERDIHAAHRARAASSSVRGPALATLAQFVLPAALRCIPEQYTFIP